MCVNITLGYLVPFKNLHLTNLVLSCRASVTQIRSGFPANKSGPTFWCAEGKIKNPVFTDEYLVRNGAAPFSTVIMTPSAFLTDEAWQQIVPRLIKGLRAQVREAASNFGISGEDADKLLIGLSFDGFKSHLKNLDELVLFADNNILTVVENRDSSEINQAFDQLVARSGKKRAAQAIDNLRRSHVVPVIDQWALIVVGLAMLRDCDDSNVWEASFLAVNMHPLHRRPFAEYVQKIKGFVDGAEKFESEVVDLTEMLPRSWLEIPSQRRQLWCKMIADADEIFDVELLCSLRAAGMGIATLGNIFKLYHAEKNIGSNGPVLALPPAGTPTVVTADTPATPKKPKMKMHLFKVPGTDMTPTEQLSHAIKVRNRALGPERATTVSPYLDVEITDDNRKFLTLSKDDLNMYHVLQQSTCRHGKRRRVAKRTLNALGDASGICGLLNDEQQLRKIKSGLQFAESFEEMKHAERLQKAAAAEVKKKKKLAAAAKRAAQLAKTRKNRKETYNAAAKKLGLQPEEKFHKCHLPFLTGTQLQVWHVCVCC